MLDESQQAFSPGGSLMQCPQCRSRRLVEIGMSISGNDVVLRCCSACDVRWWEGDGQRMPFDSLLRLASTR